jgi:hypothetical protein
MNAKVRHPAEMINTEHSSQHLYASNTSSTMFAMSRRGFCVPAGTHKMVTWTLATYLLQRRVDELMQMHLLRQVLCLRGVRDQNYGELLAATPRA